ncbi:ABC transporter [Halobacteriales archaeon SW_6_65_15]|jgi:ABC-2 type transport system permease protein|nr:MAG: ABC transporter [Halobacteriales archaeon SW_6_65_15]
MSDHLTLFRAIAKKKVVLLVRYPVNTLSQFVSIYALFAVIFFGGKAVAGPALTDSIGGIIVGFFLFTAAIVAYSGLSWNMTREAQWGTLEQLFMSPLGFGTVVSTKVVVNVLYSILWSAFILALMLVTSGESLALDVLTVGPLLVLSLASAVGVGFAFGGLALLYKRIENAFQLVQWVFIGFIGAPVGRYELLGWLPLAQGSHLLQRAMRDGVRLWEFPASELGLLVATALGYLALGYLLFHRAQRRARHHGVLGHY